MQYMLLIYSDESRMPAPQPGAPLMSPAYVAYTQALHEAGVWRAGDRLLPTTHATTVRLVDGKTEVLNGPYAETREQLGGYYLIDVPDLDAALSWAARCPTASLGGRVEVRPLWQAS
ncbi:MAG: YciI family protein [Rhizobacter sp.]|nr:YciI family protein [Rhizobacter sp.]